MAVHPILSTAPRPAERVIFHNASAFVVFQCTCHPQAPVLMLHHHQEGTVCPRCSREFIISGVQYDRATGTGLQLQVGIKEPAILRPTS